MFVPISKASLLRRGNNINHQSFFCFSRSVLHSDRVLVVITIITDEHGHTDVHHCLWNSSRIYFCQSYACVRVFFARRILFCAPVDNHAEIVLVVFVEQLISLNHVVWFEAVGDIWCYFQPSFADQMLHFRHVVCGYTAGRFDG